MWRMHSEGHTWTGATERFDFLILSCWSWQQTDPHSGRSNIWRGRHFGASGWNERINNHLYTAGGRVVVIIIWNRYPPYRRDGEWQGVWTACTGYFYTGWASTFHPPLIQTKRRASDFLSDWMLVFNMKLEQTQTATDELTLDPMHICLFSSGNHAQCTQHQRLLFILKIIQIKKKHSMQSYTCGTNSWFN